MTRRGRWSSTPTKRYGRASVSTFARTGSILRTAREFSDKGLLFPKRIQVGPAKGEVVWKPLTAVRVSLTLRNPCYAGAYAYGRRRSRPSVDGKAVVKPVPPEQWVALIPGAHPGYITIEEYRRLQEVLKANLPGKRPFAPREGPALLQGLVMCGKCGGRMYARYFRYGGEMKPDYCCRGPGGTGLHPICCQSVVGTSIDAAIGDLLLGMVTPMTLEVALAVQKEIQARIDEADQLRTKHVDRAEYEAELSRRRFMKVDPDNRLVADSLEAEWNEKLRELQATREEYERRRKDDRPFLTRRRRRRSGGLPRSCHGSGGIRPRRCGRRSGWCAC